MRKFSLIFIAAIFAVLPSSGATNFKLDPSHSEVGFKVRHLMVSNVTGKFKKFEGTFNFDEKTKTLENLTANIDVESIDTAEEKRDDHLRNADFFDTDKHEKMLFKQTKKATVKDKKTVKVQGDLTIKGITKPVTLDVTYNGAVTDPWGNRKIGFEASGKIKRKDFGLTWNKNLDGGGVVLGEDVHINLAGEAQAQAEAKN